MAMYKAKRTQSRSEDNTKAKEETKEMPKEYTTLVVAKKEVVYDPVNETRNCSTAHAMRVLAYITKQELFEGEGSWVLKVPRRTGNMDKINEFWKYCPEWVVDVNHIPKENEEAAFWFDKLGAKKEDIGFAFVSRVLDQCLMKYDRYDL